MSTSSSGTLGSSALNRPEPANGSTPPIRVELTEEESTALGFFGLADGVGGAAKGFEGPKKPAVRFVTPPHLARTPPARRPQRVEAPVIADTGVGIRVNVFPG